MRAKENGMGAVTKQYRVERGLTQDGFLGALLDDKDAWFPVKILAKTDAGIDSATKKVIEQEGADGVLEWVQLELKTDPQSKLLQLGFSAAEVEAALN